MKQTKHPQSKDTFFMQKALAQAHRALLKDEVPIGCVVVGPQGEIVAQAYNQVEAKGSQAYHAEVIALQKAAKKRNDWRLDDHWLYVTLEPCIMCIGLIVLSRIKGIVYSTQSPIFGFSLDKYECLALYTRNLIIRTGILEQESTSLLKQFFRQKRGLQG